LCLSEPRVDGQRWANRGDHGVAVKLTNRPIMIGFLANGFGLLGRCHPLFSPEDSQYTR
jgi:hypothetical protein